MSEPAKKWYENLGIAKLLFALVLILILVTEMGTLDKLINTMGRGLNLVVVFQGVFLGLAIVGLIFFFLKTSKGPPKDPPKP